MAGRPGRRCSWTASISMVSDLSEPAAPPKSRISAGQRSALICASERGIQAGPAAGPRAAVMLSNQGVQALVYYIGLATPPRSGAGNEAGFRPGRAEWQAPPGAVF